VYKLHWLQIIIDISTINPSGICVKKIYILYLRYSLSSISAYIHKHIVPTYIYIYIHKYTYTYGVHIPDIHDKSIGIIASSFIPALWDALRCFRKASDPWAWEDGEHPQVSAILVWTEGYRGTHSHLIDSLSLVGGFKHFFFSMIYGMSSFPLTRPLIFFKMVIAPPSSS